MSKDRAERERGSFFVRRIADPQQVVQRMFYIREQAPQIASPRGRLLFAGCRSSAYLFSQVVARYQQLLAQEGSSEELLYLEDIDWQFSDSETCVRLDVHVGGYDVFLFQALSNPIRGVSVDQNYMALLIAARAFREHGAKHVTAIVPYLAYARQDKPTRYMREPTTAKLMADLILEAGIDRLVTWEPHSRQLHGFYSGSGLRGIRVDLLDSLTLFAREFERFRGREDVIAVAPDAGASKFVSFFGRALDLNSAVASKYRPRPEEAVISEVIGDFAGKRVAIVLDDMISSGGTVYALIKKLVEEKGIDQVYLGASHYLGMERAHDRMLELCADYAVREIVVTDSIPQTEQFQELPCVSVKGLADVFARVINRIHYDRSVSELFESTWR